MCRPGHVGSASASLRDAAPVDRTLVMSHAPASDAAHPSARARRLERTVRRLCDQIGDRHAWKPHSLHSAARMVAESFAASRLQVAKQWYRARGVEVANVEARLPGSDGDGEVVGFVWFAVQESAGVRNGYVYSIQVRPEFRGQGHASAALRLLEDIAAGLGLVHIALHVFAFNTSAQALYRSLGYGITGVNMLKPLRRDEH